MTEPVKYDCTSQIPFKGDVREFLLDFCRVSRDSKFRDLENMARRSSSSKQLDYALDCFQSEADKWHECLKWLEAHSEA